MSGGLTSVRFFSPGVWVSAVVRGHAEEVACEDVFPYHGHGSRHTGTMLATLQWSLIGFGGGLGILGYSFWNV